MVDAGWDRRLEAASDRVALLSRRAWVLLAAAGLFALLYPFAQGPLEQMVAVALAAALGALAVGVRAAGWLTRHRARRKLSDVMAFVENDATCTFCTDAQGAIMTQNDAAAERFGGATGAVLTHAFHGLFANPHAVVHRLRDAVGRHGSAREDLRTRDGHVRVSVTTMPGGQIWRVEDIADRYGRDSADPVLPMLTAASSGTLIHMNEAMRATVGARVSRLSDVFDDLPLQSGAIRSIHGPSGVSRAAVAVFDAGPDRQHVVLLPLDDADAQPRAASAAVLDGIPVAILQLDARGRVTALNRLATKLLPRASEPDVSLAALVEGLGRPIGEWLTEAFDGRGLNRPQMAQITGSSESFVQITLGRPPNHDEDGLIAVLTDATELKTMEAQFVQSQKMQAIGQLAGGVAHDFNNLLTAITGHCDLLLLRRDVDDPDHADLSQINQNANRAAALVKQLLAFSRKQTLKMNSLDLRDTLGDMTHLLNRLVGERVRLTVDHDPALIPIRTDRRQLEQVLMNLIVNARDAMPDGGSIRIETHVKYLQQEMSRDRATVPPGQYVVVTVSDDGMGIPDDKVGRIFEPFFTTKKPGEGTGLGLSMAYGIVKQSGGFIFADSAPDTGAVFSLWFPAGHDAPDADVVTEPVAPMPAAPPTVPIMSDVRRTVLLVEDEAPVRAFAARALQLKGYDVVEAVDAEDALEQLKDANLEVDVFVTDVMMPGMDGPTWVRQAMRDRPGVRTVFVSGYTRDSLSETSVPVPGSLFLAKPFSLPDLARAVEKALA